jgi:hypothetical protein
MRLTVAGEIPTSAAICWPVWRCRRNTSTAAHVAGFSNLSFLGQGRMDNLLKARS